jgi:hypothetical protein
MVPHVGSVILSKVRLVSDAEKLKLSGPVPALREESSSCDFSQGACGPPHVTITTFRRDGYVSTRERRTRIGSSRAVHSYDAAGRLTKIEWWHDSGFRTKTLNSYDHSGRPIETVQVSEDGSRHQSETLSYDDAGRKTRLRYGDPGARPACRTRTAPHQRTDMTEKAFQHTAMDRRINT